MAGQIEHDRYITLEGCSYRATVSPFAGDVSKASVSVSTLSPSATPNLISRPLVILNLVFYYFYCLTVRVRKTFRGVR